ncbi:xanthine dehydrogenase family protein molybdopterin-binding subunit [Tropicibacter sp. R16_0]|uniref:xanthine dehydrogenase family protein molybdopterin-binding subunit n=1 Tax=Tropicibacter sp. R16_0 TaxID=2821102 RepID=UPI001ADC080E|nr:xanthine dehydrogenase family protein molybdopterin-binding subunit [Tropicibacter sp. R16_0]MBO9450503.1 xanthine dehydrogenase family protein molybdopterin-binding subunit [Tropicibacter sp. R16_0]
MPASTLKHVGTSAPTRTAPVLLRGQGQYADDVKLDTPLFIAFHRSPVSFGRITSLDVDDARESEGVLAVHTGADVADFGALAVNEVIPLLHPLDYPVLAETQVESVGQPIAAVLADTPSQAMDAAELIFADLDEDDPTPLKTVAAKKWTDGNVTDHFATAAHVVEVALQHPRLAPNPMEPRTISVAYHADTDTVTAWHSTQTPHRSRSELARILNIDPKRIRVVATHVGGAFGMKGSIYPEEVFAVWAAFTHKRNVKWTATRSEEFLSATHGRGVRSTGRLAVDAQGNFLALDARIDAPVGAWLPNSGLITAWNAARLLPSGYMVGALDVETKATQKRVGPTGIYRGAGRPEANCLMERLVDKAAKALGRDPMDMRLQNLLQSDQLPHATATGNLLDSGDYPRALTLLRDHTAYDALKMERDRRRAAGELVGIGVCFYVEPSGAGWESARVTMTDDGAVQVDSGSSSQGHERETVFAQIAADALGVEMRQITVRCGDTGTCPEGIGALASRSTAIGGSAVLKACEDIRARLDQDGSLPLTSEIRYENEGQAWGYGAYLAMLSVCADTGTPTVEKIACVDDTGRIINPDLVKGQIQGGFAQGLGEALMEQVMFDEDGQLLTGSFMDYAMPRADDVPSLDMHTFETSSPLNALGAKGVGEAGTIGAPPAILNAAVDALSPLGVTDLNMPLTAHTLWQAMQEAKQGPSS